MKIKNVRINQEMIDVLGQLIEQDINATSAFRLTRLFKDLSSIFEDKFKLEKKIFDRFLIREDGKLVIAKDEAGNEIPGAYAISDVAQFNQEMSSLMEIENEVNYEPICFEDLGLQTAKIKDLLKIEFLFQ